MTFLHLLGSSPFGAAFWGLVLLVAGRFPCDFGPCRLVAPTWRALSEPGTTKRAALPLEQAHRGALSEGGRGERQTQPRPPAFEETHILPRPTKEQQCWGGGSIPGIAHIAAGLKQPSLPGRVGGSLGRRRPCLPDFRNHRQHCGKGSLPPAKASQLLQG